VGDIDALATVEASGYPRAFHIPIRLRSRYLDAPAKDVNVLKLGSAIQYVAQVLRRGTGEFVPGVRFRFRRTGGIRIAPDSFEVTVPSPNGVVDLMPEPLEDGT